MRRLSVYWLTSPDLCRKWTESQHSYVWHQNIPCAGYLCTDLFLQIHVESEQKTRINFVDVHRKCFEAGSLAQSRLALTVVTHPDKVVRRDLTRICQTCLLESIFFLLCCLPFSYVWYDFFKFIIGKISPKFHNNRYTCTKFSYVLFSSRSSSLLNSFIDNYVRKKW